MTFDFSDHEDEYAETEAEKGGNLDEIPDGNYIVQVDDAVVKASRAGRPMLQWTLRVIVGDYRNRLMWRNNMLETKTNFGWLKKDLAQCGITLARLNDINTRCGELVDLVLEVNYKNAGKFANVYINRVLTQAEVDKLDADDAGAPAQAPASELDGGDIPF